jgi:AbrB family looped-hinge helix DNA binding protein
MEAPAALMDLENVRIMKDMRNSVNRKVNCETANIRKTVDAAVRQVEAIRTIEETEGLDSLPKNLREIARVRLDNPEMPLQELGQMLDPPLGKSGVNHRLRKLIELAEKIGVSRQSLSKWEKGESLPDLENAANIAQALGASLDELVNYDQKEAKLPMPPKGKHMFGLVQVGDKGQIVIPSRARKIFDIKAGDKLIVLGDESQGLALLKENSFMDLVHQLKG